MSALALIGYPLFGAAALNFGLGVFLLARGNRRDPLLPYTAKIAFISAVYCLAMGIAYVRASLHLPWEFFYRSAWVGWLAIAPVAQAILILRNQPARARLWGRVLYVVWGAILVLCWTTDLFEVGAFSLVPFVDKRGPLETPARLLGALSLGYLLFEMARVRRASTGRRREQIGYLLLGMAVYASAGVFLAGIPTIFRALHFDPGLVSYFSVAWIALTFYAVTRHRLFDIRFILSRAVQTMLLAATLAGSNVLLYRFLASTVGADTGVILISLLTSVVLFMTPLARRLVQTSEWPFVRRRYDYQKALVESARALASLVGVDQVLRTLLVVMRQTIGTSSGALLLAEDGAFRVKSRYGNLKAPGEFPVRAAIGRWLADRRQIFVRDEQQIVLPAAELAAIDADLGVDPIQWTVCLARLPCFLTPNQLGTLPA